jgi:hypothetical protein
MSGPQKVMKTRLDEHLLFSGTSAWFSTVPHLGSCRFPIDSGMPSDLRRSESRHARQAENPIPLGTVPCVLRGARGCSPASA